MSEQSDSKNRASDLLIAWEPIVRKVQLGLGGTEDLAELNTMIKKIAPEDRPIKPITLDELEAFVKRAVSGMGVEIERHGKSIDVLFDRAFATYYPLINLSIRDDVGFRMGILFTHDDLGPFETRTWIAFPHVMSVHFEDPWDHDLVPNIYKTVVDLIKMATGVSPLEPVPASFTPGPSPIKQPRKPDVWAARLPEPNGTATIRGSRSELFMIPMWTDPSDGGERELVYTQNKIMHDTLGALYAAGIKPYNVGFESLPKKVEELARMRDTKAELSEGIKQQMIFECKGRDERIERLEREKNTLFYAIGEARNPGEGTSPCTVDAAVEDLQEVANQRDVALMPRDAAGWLDEHVENGWYVEPGGPKGGEPWRAKVILSNWKTAEGFGASNREAREALARSLGWGSGPAAKPEPTDTPPRPIDDVTATQIADRLIKKYGQNDDDPKAAWVDLGPEIDTGITPPILHVDPDGRLLCKCSKCGLEFSALQIGLLTVGCDHMTLQMMGPGKVDESGSMPKPIWKHTCDKSIFLGPFPVGNETRDLYVCPDNPTGPTVCARYGSGPSQYNSGSCLVREENVDAFLREAWQRASDRNLIHRDKEGYRAKGPAPAPEPVQQQPQSLLDAANDVIRAFKTADSPTIYQLALAAKRAVLHAERRTCPTAISEGSKAMQDGLAAVVGLTDQRLTEAYLRSEDKSPLDTPEEKSKRAETLLVVCDGCSVLPPFEHRCHGSVWQVNGERQTGSCPCPDCRNPTAAELAAIAAEFVPGEDTDTDPVPPASLQPEPEVKVTIPEQIQTTIIFIINGVDVPVDMEPTFPLGSAMSEALRMSNNTGRPITDWRIRDEKGVTLPPDQRIERFNFPNGVRLFLIPGVGAGGGSDPSPSKSS